MAKLTKLQRRTIQTALDHAQAAFSYVMSDRTAVCAVMEHASTTRHFSRICDARVLYEVEKEYGSNLCRLAASIKTLQDMLESE